MNDDFLYKSRPPVRKAFADSLSQRLQMLDTHPHTQPTGAMMKSTAIQSGAWRFALPTLILLTALACAFAFSEPVRAKTLELIRGIAGFSVEERSESPLQPFDPIETSPTQAYPVTSPGGIPASPTPVQPTVYPVPTVPVTSMIQNPPFPFGLPAWVPDGYLLDESAGMATSNDWVLLAWKNPDLSEIELLVEREYSGTNIPSGQNASEEIKINGKPALLIRGFWDENHQWDPRRGISLDWEKEGRHYRLNYTERGMARHEIIPIQGDMGKIIEELIKMAESVP
jgi:hypothetical protein